MHPVLFLQDLVSPTGGPLGKRDRATQMRPVAGGTLAPGLAGIGSTDVPRTGPHLELHYESFRLSPLSPSGRSFAFILCIMPPSLLSSPLDAPIFSKERILGQAVFNFFPVLFILLSNVFVAARIHFSDCKRALIRFRVLIFIPVLSGFALIMGW
ncbi:hypothetical protein NPIL_450551 [Nephila pilipes]|uniref:Uncharacterized protein n=1 Tax=Nephila pilipes TaxID=299642 RepID=A0A8X6NFR0_NEPPI|nr:hypothetical protein NPIL_450551 [Nephila pilipes]